MPVLTEQEWKRHLASREFSSLYIIYGEEKYLLKRAAQQLISRTGGDSFPEFNRNEFGSEASVQAIADAAEALPFFAEHKCVSVTDFNLEEKASSEQEKLWELLENLPETTTLVFWYPTLQFDGKKSAKWRNFLKKGETLGCVLECRQRDASDLKKLLIREAEKSGCSLSRENAALILEYAGADLKNLLNEMAKLCAYQKEGEISRKLIEELVPKTTETTVFLMTNVLVAGNYQRAYELLGQLFYQNEEPIAILGALSSAYVDLYRVRCALESGLSAQAPAEYGDYKGKEFRLRNAEKNGRRMSLVAIKESLHLILEADLRLKGSRFDPRIVLEELIAKLLLAANRVEKEEERR